MKILYHKPTAKWIHCLTHTQVPALQAKQEGLRGKVQRGFWRLEHAWAQIIERATAPFMKYLWLASWMNYYTALNINHEERISQGNTNMKYSIIWKNLGLDYQNQAFKFQLFITDLLITHKSMNVHRKNIFPDHLVNNKKLTFLYFKKCTSYK